MKCDLDGNNHEEDVGDIEFIAPIVNNAQQHIDSYCICLTATKLSMFLLNEDNNNSNLMERMC
jgi:hypothetical protein